MFNLNISEVRELKHSTQVLFTNGTYILLVRATGNQIGPYRH